MHRKKKTKLVQFIYHFLCDISYNTHNHTLKYCFYFTEGNVAHKSEILAQIHRPDKQLTQLNLLKAYFLNCF